MKQLDSFRQLLLSLAVSFAVGLLFVNVYNSVVDAANWGHMLPASVEPARAYFKSADPGSFFRIASPINQVLSLIALVLCWKISPRLRVLCGIGFGLAVAGDLFTFAYFFPRNAILFQNPIEGHLDAIRIAGDQWIAMNWVRSAGVALNVLVNFLALFTLIRTQMGAAPIRAHSRIPRSEAASAQV